MAKEFDTLWGGGGGIYKDTSCAVAKAPESWRCNTINVLYPFISTPLYVAEEQYDSNQLFSQLGTPHTASGQQYEAYFGRRMRLSVEQVTGRWEPCRHCTCRLRTLPTASCLTRHLTVGQQCRNQQGRWSLLSVMPRHATALLPTISCCSVILVILANSLLPTRPLQQSGLHQRPEPQWDLLRSQLVTSPSNRDTHRLTHCRPAAPRKGIPSA